MKRILLFALFFCLIALMGVMADERASHAVDAEPVLIQQPLDQGFVVGEFLGNTDPSKADFCILSLETIPNETAMPEISFIGLTKIIKPDKTSFINFSPGQVFS
jgi:hypothetical protein